MIHENIVCPFCGCLCDDLEITTERGKIVKVRNGCVISKSKYLNHERETLKFAMIRKNGELLKVSIEKAIQRASEILKNSDYPLIYGLSSTECEAQRKAIELAELIGSTIDSTSSVCHGPTMIATQSIGAVRSTLGEIKNRADLIIFWGCNPVEAHPRHHTRYSVLSKGMFVERKGRTIVAVDVRKTTSVNLADHFFLIKPNRDFEFLSIIRSALKGYEIQDFDSIPKDHILDLVEKMKGCKFGVIFFGMGLTMSRGKHMNVDAALSLARDLNSFTKFSIIPMRGHYNVTGAGSVLSWQTGYPHSVNFSLGYPIYNPGEFSAVDVLSREEADALLVIASDPASNFPFKASRHAAKIPTIVIDPKQTLSTLIAEVVIPSAVCGISAEGTAYRMDGVPLKLRKVIESEFPSDVEILERIIEKVRA
ncbi:MAG: formylmethanofuran dehydrogenase subunit B [Candidatus Methanofastidiosia archaeon]